MGAPKLLDEIQNLEMTLRRIPVFSQFPDELFSPLVSVSKVMDYRKDHEILSQGQMNKRLLFLIEGQVSVFVDGGFVGKIEDSGSLLGEMSVIKNQPCSATLVTDSKALVVCVDTEALLNSNEEYKALYQTVLYCMYSHVLVEKLEKTNDKAKQFESTNYKLKQAEAELKSLNESLEQQVVQKMKTLEGRVSELHNEILTPLSQSSHLNPEDHARVTHALEVLAPLHSSLSSGLKLKDQKILYWDSKKKNHLITKLSLGGTGAILDQAFSWEEAESLLNQGDYALVILDQEFLGSLVQAQKLHPHGSYLAILDGHIQDHLEHFEGLDENLRFFFRSADKKSQIQNMLGAVTKILTNHHFGLEPYTGFGVEVRQERIKSSDQRAELLEQMDQYLSDSGVRPSYRDRARLVAEELLMNAVYDAPCDPVTRQPLFNHLPRTEGVVLEPQQQGLLSFAFDGTRILVSVRDPFGSLKPQTIYKYLKNSYAPEPQEINAQEGKGGAGRGLHQIVEASSELVFNLSPGKKTEVISVIYTEKSEEEAEGSRIQLFVE